MRMVTSDSLPPELLGALDALSLHPAVRPLALVLGPDRPGARDLVARFELAFDVARRVLDALDIGD